MTGDYIQPSGIAIIFTRGASIFSCAAPALLTGEQSFHTQSRDGTLKGRTLNPEPVIPLALSLISMYNNYRCEYCIPVARISGGDLDTAHVLF